MPNWYFKIGSRGRSPHQHSRSDASYHLHLKAVLITIAGMKFWAGLLGLLLVVAAMAGETNRRVRTRRFPWRARSVFGYDPTADFIAFDPQYREKHNHYRTDY